MLALTPAGCSSGGGDSGGGGTYIPPKPSLRLTTDIIQFCSNELPSFNAISISGTTCVKWGSTAAQEIAFTLAHGLCYVEGRQARLEG